MRRITQHLGLACGCPDESSALPRFLVLQLQSVEQTTPPASPCAWRKRATYPELQRGGSLRPGCGGRGSLERRLAGAAWTPKWWGMLSTVTQQWGAPWLVSNGASGYEPAFQHSLS